MVDWVDIDGNTIASGVAVDPGAIQAGIAGIGTITTVTPGDTTNTITFTSVTGASSYNLYWDTSAGVTTADNKITGVTSPYIHTGRTNGVTYYYISTPAEPMA